MNEKQKRDEQRTTESKWTCCAVNENIFVFPVCYQHSQGSVYKIYYCDDKHVFYGKSARILNDECVLKWIFERL